MNHLVVGAGEIGKSLYEVLNRHVTVFLRDVEDDGRRGIDVLHVAIPYSEKFIQIVQEYQEIYAPKLTIIYSTVPIGTTNQIAGAAHSPVEGRHPHLAKSIQEFPRWVASKDPAAVEQAADIWLPIVGVVRTMQDAIFTEWLKMRSTSKYGVSLVWADYEKEVSMALGMDFKANKDFDEDYNRLYRKLGLSQFQRYILDPPNGEIGGHCVVPNAELLDEQYPNPLLKLIKKFKKKDSR
jgi:hypothetical protein